MYMQLQGRFLDLQLALSTPHLPTHTHTHYTHTMSLKSNRNSLYSYVLHFIIEQQYAECDAQIESGTVGTYECCAFCEVQAN